MTGMRKLALSLAALPAMLGIGATSSTAEKTDAAIRPAAISADYAPKVMVIRRLSEAQYRNTIADIFGPDIKVAGRFEPIVRPTHELLAVAARESTISPAGFAQLEAIARNIAAQVFDKDHRAMFVRCAPANPMGADSACARQVLLPAGRLLFRRPLSASEGAYFVKIADDLARQTQSFDEGLKHALATMLTSPKFLYVLESVEPDPQVPGGLRLDNYSRAARLSYLLWNTTPNEALLKAAEQGKLTDQASLNAIAAGMVNSPRFEAGTRAFFADMLMFEKMNDLTKDGVIFPRFNAEVAAAMPEQMQRTIVDLLVRRSGDYRDLFTTRSTFMTRSLGPLYGVALSRIQGWEPYEFPAASGRAGIMSLAGFLSVGEAQVGRSSPTIRGRAIREVLLCQPVPDPPGDVNFDAFEQSQNGTVPTARLRLAVHSTSPVCAGCHSITDPIGLSLEKFDGIGAFRATENGAAIDTSGTFEGIDYSDAAGLGEALSRSASTTECVAARALEYATAQGHDAVDFDTLDELNRGFAQDGFRFKALMLRVATLPQAYRYTTTRPGGGPYRGARK